MQTNVLGNKQTCDHAVLPYQECRLEAKSKVARLQGVELEGGKLGRRKARRKARRKSRRKARG
jgi:hypothetical protein